MAISISKAFNLTAAGQFSPREDVSRAINASYNVTVAGVVTNVVLRPEFSLNGGTSWFPCNATDTTITAPGQYMIPVMANNVQPPLVRLNWVSTTGGTPTVAGIFRMTK